jgi:hypothetical protein
MKPTDSRTASRKEALVSRKKRLRLLLVAVVAAPVFAGGTMAMDVFVTQARAVDARSAATGTLAFNADLDVRYPAADCDADTPSGIECFARTGRGIIRGLGTVEVTYAYKVEAAPAGCVGDEVRVLPATARLSVPGKGEIDVSLGGSGCTPRESQLRAEEAFTITGGSGRYAGATGGGAYVDVSFGPPSYRGKDSWRGTLVVPGLEFDVTAPVLIGARNRTLRIARGRKRIRVSYSVTARDDVDGALSATCRPRSGSWFRVGRTTVYCSAIDTSGNEKAVSFAVKVKRAR